MSTRAHIEFFDMFGTLAARIYQHSDGYPEGEDGPARSKHFDERGPF